MLDPFWDALLGVFKIVSEKLDGELLSSIF